MWGLYSSLSEMWKDTSFAVKLAVTHIVKYLKLPSGEMWKQEGWHGHTSAVVTSCGLLLTAAQWGTHRTSKGHITVWLLQLQGGQGCKPWETACVCVDGAGKGKKTEDRTDGRGAFAREWYVVWVSRPPLALRLYCALCLYFLSPSVFLQPLALWFMPNLCNYSVNRSSRQFQRGWSADMPHHLRAATRQLTC